MQPPIISFRWNKNLRDEPVRGRFIEKKKKRQNWLKDLSPNGNHKYCKYMLKDKKVQMGAIQDTVHVFITCRSDFVVCFILPLQIFLHR